MRDYLKHYRVKISVLSPVYIGSGEKQEKKSISICHGIIM